jgi:hypothetical protein
MDNISYTLPPVPKFSIPLPGTAKSILRETALVDDEVDSKNVRFFVPVVTSG